MGYPGGPWAFFCNEGTKIGRGKGPGSVYRPVCVSKLWLSVESYQFSHKGYTDFWLGMTDLDHDGNFKWLDGTTPLNHSYFGGMYYNTRKDPDLLKADVQRWAYINSTTGKWHTVEHEVPIWVCGEDLAIGSKKWHFDNVL